MVRIGVGVRRMFDVVLAAMFMVSDGADAIKMWVWHKIAPPKQLPPRLKQTPAEYADRVIGIVCRTGTYSDDHIVVSGPSRWKTEFKASLPSSQRVYADRDAQGVHDRLVRFMEVREALIHRR